MTPIPLEHTTAPDLLCKSPCNSMKKMTYEALKNTRAVHCICVGRTKKPVVNEASLKQGVASLCCRKGPSLCGSFLSTKLLFYSPLSLCYLALPSALCLPCLLLQYSRTGKKTKTQQIHTHVTAPVSGGWYLRAAMCSCYLVTVLCWGYSNWNMFSSCKMKTPCLLLVTTTSVFCSLGLSYFLGLVKLSLPI